MENQTVFTAQTQYLPIWLGADRQNKYWWCLDCYTKEEGGLRHLILGKHRPIRPDVTSFWCLTHLYGVFLARPYQLGQACYGFH